MLYALSFDSLFTSRERIWMKKLFMRQNELIKLLLSGPEYPSEELLSFKNVILIQLYRKIFFFDSLFEATVI